VHRDDEQTCRLTGGMSLQGGWAMLSRLGAAGILMALAGCGYQAGDRPGSRPLVVPPPPRAQQGFETELSRMPTPSHPYSSPWKVQPERPSASQLLKNANQPQSKFIPQSSWPEQAHAAPKTSKSASSKLLDQPSDNIAIASSHE
jgi:hypothetical protein